MKIVSKGSGAYTEIFDDNGKPITNVTAIKIPRFKGTGAVTAILTCTNVELDLEIDDNNVEVTKPYVKQEQE